MSLGKITAESYDEVGPAIKDLPEPGGAWRRFCRAVRAADREALDRIAAVAAEVSGGPFDRRKQWALEDLEKIRSDRGLTAAASYFRLSRLDEIAAAAGAST